jgi:S1-C subfamily serine protease
VLLDLVVVLPVTDARLRYHVSRQLFERKLGPTLSELLERLEQAGPLLRGVTLEAAGAGLELLSNAGIQAVSGPSAPAGFTKIRWKLVALAGALGIVLLALSVFWLQRGSIGFGAPTPRVIAARALDSVVTLSCGEKLGSGFFVTEHTLITNEHVTCGPTTRLEVVMRDGSKGTARVTKSSKRFDAAVLEVDGLEGKPLAIESAGKLAAGDAVMVIGNPVGLESTFHVGTISNPHRILLDVCYLQLDARINPGNSGGPALDDEGRVIGIVSMKRSDAEGIGMALPIDYLYDEATPLLEPPPSHPTPGFAAMLTRVENEVKKLEHERESIGFRLVQAVRKTRTNVVAVVVTMSSGLPKSNLDFKLESGGTVCRKSADMTWKISDPTDPFATRTRDFMRGRGLGEVYVGGVELDFSSCKEPPGPGAALVLCDGDETTNRAEL